MHRPNQSDRNQHPEQQSSAITPLEQPHPSIVASDSVRRLRIRSMGLVQFEVPFFIPRGTRTHIFGK